MENAKYRKQKNRKAKESEVVREKGIFQIPYNKLI